MIRVDPKWARHAVYQRDKGVCAACGLDTNTVKATVKEADARARDSWCQHTRRHYTGYRLGGRCPTKPREGSFHHYAMQERKEVLEPLGMAQWWWRKTWWDMDHVVAVDERGGHCDLRNLQTLCLPCHSKRSSEQRRRWSGKARKLPRMPHEECEHDCKLSDEDLCSGCSAYRARVLCGTAKGR